MEREINIDQICAFVSAVGFAEHVVDCEIISAVQKHMADVRPGRRETVPAFLIPHFPPVQKDNERCCCKGN